MPNPNPTAITTVDKNGKTEHNAELAEAEADVERARARVAQSVMALRDEVVRRTDWRGWVRRRPGVFVAAALAVGFLLGHRRGAAAPISKNRRTRSWR